uniref:Protein kinase domain-containing protein n=1 Tax=Oryzias melastigma TaxID=30732 RepID=A0A3B3D9I2_ORYME
SPPTNVHVHVMLTRANRASSVSFSARARARANVRVTAVRVNDVTRQITSCDVILHHLFSSQTPDPVWIVDKLFSKNKSSQVTDDLKNKTQEKMSRTGNTDTSFDVKEGHYLVGNRGIYKVWGFLGEGSFGKVAKCTKLGGHEFCAIKIMKRNKTGLREMESMKLIKHLDPEENHLIEMYECFTFQNVTCIVYELLEESLHDIVWRNPGVTHLCDIRSIAQHLLKALKALKSIGLAHCDIKLDNIMLADHRTTNMKLIDFGLAVEAKKLSIGTVIQVNPFRAPEVILGLPMDESVDMWALGMVSSLHMLTWVIQHQHRLFLLESFQELSCLGLLPPVGSPIGDRSWVTDEPDKERFTTLFMRRTRKDSPMSPGIASPEPYIGARPGVGVHR